MHSVSEACASGWLSLLHNEALHTDKQMGIADIYCHEFSYSPYAAVHKFVCLHLHEYVIKRESRNAHTHSSNILDFAFPANIIYRTKHHRCGYNITLSKLSHRVCIPIPAQPYRMYTLFVYVYEYTRVYTCTMCILFIGLPMAKWF